MTGLLLAGQDQVQIGRGGVDRANREHQHGKKKAKVDRRSGRKIAHQPESHAAQVAPRKRVIRNMITAERNDAEITPASSSVGLSSCPPRRPRKYTPVIVSNAPANA